MSGVLTLSTQALIKLQNIESALLRQEDWLKKLANADGSYRGQVGSWTWVRKGKAHFFYQLVTFAGSTMNIDLTLPFVFQLNRITQVFNDATAKDFDIRVYEDPAIDAYASLLNATGNTSTSVVTQRGEEYRFETNARIRLYYSNFTADKTVRIRIQVNEL